MSDRMSKGREPAGRSHAPATRTEPDGGRARFEIAPEQVWQPRPPAPPPSAAEDRRAFFAPMLRVAVITSALLYGSIAAGVALWSWLH